MNTFSTKSAARTSPALDATPENSSRAALATQDHPPTQTANNRSLNFPISSRICAAASNSRSLAS